MTELSGKGFYDCLWLIAVPVNNIDAWFSLQWIIQLGCNPKKALLADTNTHIIQFYNNLKNQVITSKTVKLFLQENGQVLKKQGESYYY